MNTTLLRSAIALLPFALAAQTGFDIALTGDMPYGATTEPRYERLIADINAFPGIEFTAHIGDTKSGSTRCDDSHYPKVLNWFNSFSTALIYTPGDNEWTDCMRTSNGSFEPLNRLALIRKTYFNGGMSLGRRPVLLQRQSDDPQYAKFVENAMYVKAPVVFATFHMTGSNNNYQYKNVQGANNQFYDNDQEFNERNRANLAWLTKAFQTARESKSLGIMLLMQANLFEAFMETSTGANQSGFADFVKALRTETSNFAGEVVVVGGDSHYFRIDKPMTDQFPACTSAAGDCRPFDAALDTRGTTLLNLTRVEVPGSSNIHWLLCHIRPTARNLFTFEFMTVADRPAVGVSATVSKADIETTAGQLMLDASGSTSTNSGELTYTWSIPSGYPQAAITGLNTATPTVQMSVRGVYQFVVTVTDRTGASGTATVKIRFV